MSKKSVLATIILAALAATAISAAVIQYLGLIETTGTVATTEATINPAVFDWGTVTIGENVTRTANITNTGNQAINLTASINNTSANLINYTLTWDAENLVLDPGYWIPANFTLTVYDNNDTAPFNFDIIIGDQT